MTLRGDVLLVAMVPAHEEQDEGDDADDADDDGDAHEDGGRAERWR